MLDLPCLSHNFLANSLQGFLDEEFERLLRLQDDDNPHFVAEVVAMVIEEAQGWMAEVERWLNKRWALLFEVLCSAAFKKPSMEFQSTRSFELLNLLARREISMQRFGIQQQPPKITLT